MSLYSKEIETPIAINGRVAMRLSQMANTYKEEIFLEDNKGRRVSVKSLLGLLSLGIQKNERFKVFVTDKAPNPEETIRNLLSVIGGAE